MKKFYFYYLFEDTVIRVGATRKPRIRAKPYVVHEFIDGKWQMPCFPEISGGKLAKMNYIGKTEVMLR